MAVKILPFDVVGFLKTERDMTGYLAAAFEDGDPQLIAAALGDVARARGAMSKIAKSTGLTRSSLYKSLSKAGNPALGTVVKATQELGYSITVVRARPARAKRAAKAAPRRRASA